MKGEKRVEVIEHVDQEAVHICEDEVWKAFTRMKNGKAFGPDDVPVNV